MKLGMNVAEIAKARALSKGGASSGAISKALLVDEEVIKGFLPKEKKRRKTKKAKE